MARRIFARRTDLPRPSGVGLALAMLGSLPGAAYADESGISYWLPGGFSGLAAVPQVLGWSMAAVYYHTTVEASGNIAARQIQVGRFPTEQASAVVYVLRPRPVAPSRQLRNHAEEYRVVVAAGNEQ